MKIFDLNEIIEIIRKKYGKYYKNSKDIKQSAYKNVLREISILRQLRHRNIIQFIEVICFEEEHKVYVVMELAEGGELFRYIVDKIVLGEAAARKFFRQLVSAVEYLHGNFVVHRDLKLENILLNKRQDSIKVADFGLSEVIEPGKLCKKRCGSLQYMAPEIIDDDCGYVGPPSDIWSMGVLLYTMVMGSLPFCECRNERELLAAIASGSYLHKSDISRLSDECIDLLIRILNPNPDTRITMDAIREHPWVNKGYITAPRCALPAYVSVQMVDPDIVNALCYFGFKPREITAKVIANVRCQVVAMYHLLAAKKEAESCNCQRQRRTSFSSPSSEDEIRHANQIRVQVQPSVMTKNYCPLKQKRRLLVEKKRPSSIESVHSLKKQEEQKFVQRERGTIKVDTTSACLYYDPTAATQQQGKSVSSPTTTKSKLPSAVSSLLKKSSVNTRRFSLKSAIIRRLSPRSSPIRQRRNSSPIRVEKCDHS